MDPGALDRIVSGLEIRQIPELIVGIQQPDDAGVFKLNDEIALVQTLDFLTPVTDSPYEFGLIAAANSLSDVYAMGGTPLTAMNIVCFSIDDYTEEVLKETLAGGLEKIHEAGAVLVGGHSVDDKEFKYGLSVTGKVHPHKVLINGGSNIGDQLILTKPIGTGVLSTALKGKIADETAMKLLVKTASTLNKYAAEIMLQFNPSACTDVTGFGLAGHVLEMAEGSKTQIIIDSTSVPLIDMAEEYAKMGLIPAGSYKTRDYCEKKITMGTTVNSTRIDLLFDPQTSGGLIFSLDPARVSECMNVLTGEGVEAAVVGEVKAAHGTGCVTII